MFRRIFFAVIGKARRGPQSKLIFCVVGLRKNTQNSDFDRQSSKFNTPTNEFNLDTSADLKNYSMSQSGQKYSADAIIMCRALTLTF